ncbi:MAG: EAL domain-containing protein, partial [Selenomonadaceae bacterium]|nr:EAL domain-containing protein [Selenomonadaceae bacterium]
ELEPSMIRLEITETAYMDEPEKIISMIKEFRAHGFAVMMDDFGSGHSSLSMLKNLPVDVLKLDMSFTREAGSSKRVYAILKFIMDLSKALTMDVIVEGVETKDQLDVIASLGCHKIQGYYFGRPMPKDDFMRTLEEQFEREKAVR